MANYHDSDLAKFLVVLYVPATVLLERSAIHEPDLGEEDGIEERHLDQLVQLQLHFEFVLFLLDYKRHYVAVQNGGGSRTLVTLRYTLMSFRHTLTHGSTTTHLRPAFLRGNYRLLNSL